MHVPVHVPVHDSKLPLNELTLNEPTLRMLTLIKLTHACTLACIRAC